MTNSSNQLWVWQGCNPIYSNGAVGQVVALYNVILSDNNILYGYPQPSLFTIAEKDEAEDGHYTLRDMKGEIVKIEQGRCHCFYDAQELVNAMQREQEIKALKHKRTSDNFNLQVQLLKSILVEQGMKLVTQSQLDALGLTLQ